MRIEDKITHLRKDIQITGSLPKDKSSVYLLKDTSQENNVTYILNQGTFDASIWENLETILHILKNIINILNAIIKSDSNQDRGHLKNILQDLKSLYKISENIKEKLNTLEDNYNPNSIKNMLEIFKSILSIKDGLEKTVNSSQLNIFCKQEIDNLKNATEQIKSWQSLIENCWDKGFIIFPLLNFKRKDKNIEVMLCYKKVEGRRAGFSFVLDIPTENLGRVKILGKVLGRVLELEGEVNDVRFKKLLNESERYLRDNLAKTNYKLKRLYIRVSSLLKEYEEKKRIELEV
ncbi:MAG: hypothetical protein NC820_03830 [Candidatus Omnitrophica bacterium]|nr:hypothetical protein [Candidatus Omnitrophota bacterium]